MLQNIACLLSGVSPGNVPPVGGTKIIVTGSGFSPSELLSCVFQFKAIEEMSSTADDWLNTAVIVTATWISPEASACATPPLAKLVELPSNATVLPNLARVAVSNNGMATDGSWAEFVVSNVPILEAIAPTIGPVTGHTAVTLLGGGFLDTTELSCTFGGTRSISVEFASPNRVVCLSPSLLTETNATVEGEVDETIELTVSNNGIDYSTPGHPFRYLSQVKITEIYPRLVSREEVAEGAAAIRISAKNFSQYFADHSIGDGGKLTCRFDGLGDSIADLVRPTMIMCPLPAVETAVGQVLVTVSVNGYDFPSIEYGKTITLASAPQAASMFPEMGPSVGGTVVKIQVEKYGTLDPLVCTFHFGNDTNIDVHAECDGEKLVSCTTPPVPSTNRIFLSNSQRTISSMVSVAAAERLPSKNITTEAGVFATVEFMYYPTPVVTEVQPRIGAAGTHITIIGVGFLDSPGLMCRFGEISQMPTNINGNAIACKVPRQEADDAAVTVEISNNLVDWTNNGVEFAYRPRTVVKSVAPKMGPVSGNTIVRVAVVGIPINEDDLLSCRFGATHVRAVRASDNELLCASPVTIVPGSVSLEVAENGVELSDSGWRFDYVPDIGVSGAGPLTGSEEGGTVIRITGSGFLGVEPVVCEFGAPGFRVAGRWLTRTAFECETPPRRPGVAPLRISTNGQQYLDTGLVYTYQPQATVRALLPTSGSVSGGTIIVISGTGFVSSTKMACLVGERMGEATYIDSTRVRCRVPRAEIRDRISYVAVRIANNGVDFTDSFGVTFAYVPPFDVSYINPNVGATTGGTVINVHGMGFSTARNIQCVIDSVAVKSILKSAQLLTCTAPGKATAGMVNVELISDAIDTSSTTVMFLYHTPVEVVSVYPSSAPENGGSTLLISGSGFVETAELACIFTISTGRGTSLVEREATFSSGSLISCESPGGSVGTAYVQVTNNGADISNSSLSFAITSASTVTSLWPPSGSTNGGTRVRVQGTGFLNSSTVFCRFGSNIVSSDDVLDYTSVVCTAPPRESEGSVSVEVTNNNLDWTSSRVEFNYRPPISISSVSPKIGPASGGTVLRVDATGINAAVDGGAISCQFGHSSVSTAVIDSNGTVLCVSPPKPSLGSSSLELTRHGVEFTSDGWMFHYVPDVTIASAWPLSGPESGGTLVALNGTGFSDMGLLVCEFGSSGTQVAARGISATTGYCTSPPHMPGVISLRVSVNGQQFVETGIAFEYLVESAVRYIQPSLGPAHGGTMVDVVGTAFVNSTALSCRFAGRSVHATFVSKERVRCVTPPMASPSVLPLEISNNGVDFTSSGALFSFVTALEIKVFWPTSGPTTGGTLITVQGSGFLGGSTVECILNEVQVPAAVYSDDELSCLTPSMTVEGPRYLRVANNGIDEVSSSTTFTYVAPIRLVNVKPPSSAEEGGVTVIIEGRNFVASPTLSCRFGSQGAVLALWLSSTQVSCVVPPTRSGPREVTLTVTNNGQDFAAGALTYTYLPVFTLLKLDPVEGPVDGGTEVTLIGTGLGQAGPWACIFGQSFAVPAAQLENESLKCRSPPKEPGLVSVRAFRSPSSLISATSGAIGAAAANTLQDFGLTFLYQATVYISTVEPRSGSILGGTPVTLRGFGFANASALTCGFGKPSGKLLTSPAVRASPGMTVCLSPPLSSDKIFSVAFVNPSVVSIMVSLNGVDFTSRGPQYVYYEPVEVLAVFPRLGSTNGGTVVTVVGRNFLPSEGLSCRFGVSAPSPAKFIASDALRCVAPPTPAGLAEVEVTVSNNVIEFSDSSATFAYHPATRPERFSPVAGPLSGGTVVAVDGRGFSSTSRLECRFGRVTVKATLVSSARILCITPESSRERRVPLHVTVNGVDWEEVGTVANTSLFTYYQQPKLVKLHPSTGSLFGGTRVSIFMDLHGSILEADSIVCRFGNVSVPSVHTSSKAIYSTGLDGVEAAVQCNTPDLGAEAFMGAEVAVSIDGGVHFSSALTYTYLEVRTREAAKATCFSIGRKKYILHSNALGPKINLGWTHSACSCVFAQC